MYRDMGLAVAQMCCWSDGQGKAQVDSESDCQSVSAGRVATCLICFGSAGEYLACVSNCVILILFENEQTFNAL